MKDFMGADLKVDFVQESVPQGSEPIEYQVILTEKNQDSVNLQLLQLGEA